MMVVYSSQLTHDGRVVGALRHDVEHEKLEDGEGEEHGDAECDLLVRVGGEDEDDERHDGHEGARQHERRPVVRLPQWDTTQ